MCEIATNDYVIVQANVAFGLTNAVITNNATLLTAAGAAIQWSGGEPVSGNPLQRAVSKTNSVETIVTASLGGSTTNLNVWVIWATVSIQMSGTNPSPLPFIIHRSVNLKPQIIRSELNTMIMTLQSLIQLVRLVPLIMQLEKFVCDNYTGRNKCNHN